MENNDAPQYYQPLEPTWNNDAPETDPGRGLAIASLVTGILSVVLCGSLLIWLPAIICGIVAKAKGSKSGMAIAGLVLGIIGLIIWICYLCYLYTHPEVLQAIMQAWGMNT